MGYFKSNKNIWLRQYGYKVCNKCNQLKLLTDFRYEKAYDKKRINKMKWSSWCKTCLNRKNGKRKDDVKKKQRARDQLNDSYIKRLLDKNANLELIKAKRYFLYLKRMNLDKLSGKEIL